VGVLRGVIGTPNRLIYAVRAGDRFFSAWRRGVALERFCGGGCGTCLPPVSRGARAVHARHNEAAIRRVWFAPLGDRPRNLPGVPTRSSPACHTTT
jgi:hypothetical protein